MARIKFLIFALVAIGLAAWNMMSEGAPVAAPPRSSAPAPVASLEGPANAVKALLESRTAWERAAAQTAVTSEPLATALAAAAKNGGTPAADAAGPLKAAADQAMAPFPEAARHYVVVALATATGALASVPGHEPLTAASFPWIDAALKAGPEGYPADVAGKKVVVYAAPVRALVKDEVKELGSVAIAFSRDPADWAPFVSASPMPFTLVAGHKVVASSDKAHADELATVSAAGPSTFKGGNAFAVAVPGLADAYAVVAASAPAASASAASAPAPAGAGTMNAKISLGALVVLALIFLGLMPGDSAAATEPVTPPSPPSPSMVRVDDDALRASLAAPPPASEPIIEAPPPPPAPPPAPAAPPPLATAGRLGSAPPPLPPKPAPAAAAPAADGKMGSFDDLFGPPSGASAAPAPPPLPAPAPAPASKPGGTMMFGAIGGPSPGAPSRPAPAPADPLGFLNSSKASDETTGAMSRQQLSSLAAQSAVPDAIPLPSTSPSMATVPLPSSAPDPFALASEGQDPLPTNHERTVVAAVPQELLRAAGQRPAGTNGPGVAGPLAATANAEELHFQDVYREFLQVRERCGEPQENLTFEKFSAKLRKNKEQLVQKYACKSVRFQVYVKEGKAALKATPVKEA